MSTAIKAAERLKTREVNAATDLAGAIKYLKDVFKEYSLDCKAIDAEDEDWLHVVFNGPLESIEVDIMLTGGNSIAIHIIDGLLQFGIEMGKPRSVIRLNSEVSPKEVNKFCKEFDNYVKEAQQYLENMEKSRDWVKRFSAAVAQIQKDMDKVTPKSRTKFTRKPKRL